jgi:hypothetical protein
MQRINTIVAGLAKLFEIDSALDSVVLHLQNIDM